MTLQKGASLPSSWKIHSSELRNLRRCAQLVTPQIQQAPLRGTQIHQSCPIFLLQDGRHPHIPLPSFPESQLAKNLLLSISDYRPLLIQPVSLEVPLQKQFLAGDLWQL